jgi:hypothetical protein
MDMLGNLGQIVGNFFQGGGGKLLESGLTGAGLIGNLLTQKQRSDELSYLQNQQKQLQDPTALAKQVAAATQPLNTGLVQGVENQVQGSLAEQGLSQAPGIQAAVLSQALAPFEQQNQQTALQLVLQRLGLPLSYASTYLQGLPQPANLSPLLALLQSKPGTGGYQNYGPSMAQLLQQPPSYQNYGPFQSAADVSPNLFDANLPDITAGVSA